MGYPAPTVDETLTLEENIRSAPRSQSEIIFTRSRGGLGELFEKDGT
jgi:hypothetical protein